MIGHEKTGGEKTGPEKTGSEKIGSEKIGSAKIGGETTDRETAAAGRQDLRIGIDLGGTKIEAVMLDCASRVVGGPIRVPTPRHDYAATLTAIADLVARLEAAAGLRSTGDGFRRGNLDPKRDPNLDQNLDQNLAPYPVPVGIGMPGSIMPATGLVQNANSTWLNGKPFAADVTARLGPRVRFANDANCFALSEATDGAGRNAHTVFGVILGTGCGGGLVVGGQLVNGPMGIAGEWGHNPLPWPEADEVPGPTCWCGRQGCMEAWVSGPALAAAFAARSGTGTASDDARPDTAPDTRPEAAPDATPSEIAERARNGHTGARDLLTRHTSRLARGLAHVVNIFDPDVIVLGGGLSHLNHLYSELAPAMRPHLFTDHPHIDIRAPAWGAASGVRGAAWLWPASNAGTSHPPDIRQ